MLLSMVNAFDGNNIFLSCCGCVVAWSLLCFGWLIAKCFDWHNIHGSINHEAILSKLFIRQSSLHANRKWKWGETQVFFYFSAFLIKMLQKCIYFYGESFLWVHSIMRIQKCPQFSALVILQPMMQNLWYCNIESI